MKTILILVALFIASLMVCEHALCFGSGITYMYSNVQSLTADKIPAGMKGTFTFRESSLLSISCSLEFLRNGVKFGRLSISKSNSQSLVIIPDITSDDVFSFKRGGTFDTCTIEIDLTYDDNRIFAQTDIVAGSLYQVLVPKGKTVVCTLSMNTNSKVEVETDTNTFFRQTGNSISLPEVKLTSPASSLELFTFRVGFNEVENTGKVGMNAIMRDSTPDDLVSRDIGKVPIPLDSLSVEVSNIAGTIIGAIVGVLLFCCISCGLIIGIAMFFCGGFAYIGAYFGNKNANLNNNNNNNNNNNIVVAGI